MKLFQNKTVRIALIALLVLALVFAVLLMTAKSRVVGTWQREVVYLEHYGCDSIMVTTFHADGTANSLLTNAQTGAILNASSGYWDMSGFEASYSIPSKDGKTVYTFNPITGNLKNGNYQYQKLN